MKTHNGRARTVLVSAALALVAGLAVVIVLRARRWAPMMSRVTATATDTAALSAAPVGETPMGAARIGPGASAEDRHGAERPPRMSSDGTLRLSAPADRVVAPPPDAARIEPGASAGDRHGAERPPWLSADGTLELSSPTDRVVSNYAREIMTGAGPMSAEHALRLLDASQDGVGMIGAAILVHEREWSAEMLRKVAEHRDLAVPFFALRALLDAGRDAEAVELRGALLGRTAEIEEWMETAVRSAIPATVWRGVLDLAGEQHIAAERRLALAEAILRNEDADYPARMRALLEYRSIVPFAEFRQKVVEELTAAPAAEPNVWRAGLERLVQRLEGPVEVHGGPQALTAADVEIMTAREYPAMYEDLALRLEAMLHDPRSVFAVGVGSALTRALMAGENTPQSDDERQALQRIRTATARIVESDAQGRLHAPPPGS